VLECLTQARGLLFVVSGPSGSGKDTVLEEVEKCLPNLWHCVTATTRARRDGEPEKSYSFVSEATFRELVESNQLLEHAVVHGNYYGTPRQPVLDKLDEGRDVVLKIDVQGAASVKHAMPGAIMIFIAPPSLEVLEQRLRGRGTETEDVLQRRLADARHEISLAENYDYIVCNDLVSDAADRLKSIMTAEHCKVVR
jgi:guanylate kinase